jgi:hypothetical protein
MCARAGQLARYQMGMLKRTRVRVFVAGRFDKRIPFVAHRGGIGLSVGLAGPKWDNDPSSAQ